MSELQIQTAKLSQLQASKTNPRQFFDKKSMAELVESIRESGVITPLLVRPTKNSHFEIVAGERRYRAAMAADKDAVPVIVREMTDEEALSLQIIENDQRQDVHPLEQCAGYQRLQKEAKLTLEQLATRVGKSVGYVRFRLKYADLIEPIRKMFFDWQINGNHAILAARLQPEQQKEIIPWLKRGSSAEQLKGEIERHFFLVLKDAPFDTASETLVPKAGSCVNCPKRTGFHKELFEDVKNADTCTDPACFEEKTRAFIKIQVGTHKDAILLTIGDQYSAPKPKGTIHWVVAGKQKCPDTKQGVVVEKTGYHVREKQEAKLGQALNVCTNPKCKTHNPRVVSDYNPSTGGSRAADKKRKLELRRRGLVFKELAAEKFTVKDKDFRAILDWAIRGLSSDHARALCQAMELEIAAAKHLGKDYHGTIEKHLAKLDAKGVENWLYLVMLADTDLWFYNHAMNPSCKNLEAKAKEAGVPLATIAKLAKEKKKAVKPEAKAAKK